MKVLLSYLPLLGCAGAMLLCVRMMGGRSKDQAKPDAGEVAELRAEVDRLRTELERSPGREHAARE